MEVFELFRDKNNTEYGAAKYMNRFSNDVVIAVEQAVKRAVHSVTEKWRPDKGR